MKTVVIKLGGSAIQNDTVIVQLGHLIKDYKKQGYQVTLIHGGGHEINQALIEKGIQWQFINGQRQTTPEMMTVIEDVLFHKINKRVQSHLKKLNIDAVSLSGKNHQLLVCEIFQPELICVGKVVEVNSTLLRRLFIDNPQIVPIISPIGCLVNDMTTSLNINADWAAVQIAIALKADKLLFLTDQDGVWNENKKTISMTDPFHLEKLIANDVIQGGMMTKVRTMIHGIENGIGEIRVIHAQKAVNLIEEPFLGTQIVAMTPDKQVSTNSTFKENYHG